MFLDSLSDPLIYPQFSHLYIEDNCHAYLLGFLLGLDGTCSVKMVPDVTVCKW